MKKLVSLLSVLLFGVAIASAQDLITKKSGEDIKAIVTEVNPTNVKYRRFDNPDGPLFTINKSEIAVIRYANGENEVFNQSQYAGQVVPKYKDLKMQYNPKDYVRMSSDPYNPAWIGVASFFVPGLGQIICGEVGRGLAFLGGSVAVGAVAGAAYANSGSDAVLLATSAAALALDIWAIVDAVQVAKVKDMFQQGQYAFSVKMYPSVNYMPGSNLSPGVTLAINF